MSAAEVRALSDLDLALHPSEPDAVHLERAEARFEPKPEDALRLPPPSAPRSRTQGEMQRRLLGVIERAELVPPADDAIGRMVDAVRSLAGIQLQIDASRRRGRS